MIRSDSKSLTQGKLAICTALLSLASFPVLAQGPPPPEENYPPQGQQGPAPLLPPDQLDSLVAPVALYPDQLLSQVLAASTYPLEIVEADRWLQQNRGLRGAQLLDAAKQQPWDASVQALVAFPDALALLNRDIRWTTDLGNAFLSQQADVMNAIQTMRARAQDNGRLASTPQQVVTPTMQDGQSAIQIQPADPQVVYVPVYNPSYVWGAPAYDPWPSLWYPGAGYGFGFGPACFLGSLFSGFLGFGGWGWGLNWFAHGLFLNAGFFGHYGFRGYGGYGGFRPGYGGHVAWAHDPGHRMGVPYSNRTVASRFNGRFEGGRFEGGRFNGGGYNGNSFRSGNAGAGRFGGNSFNGNGRSFEGNRSEGNRFNEGSARFNNSQSRGFEGGNNRGFESRGNESRGYESTNRGSAFNSRAGNEGYRAPAQSYRGFSNSIAPSSRGAGPSAQSFSGQHYSAPQSHAFSAPQGRALSAPRASPSAGGGGHFSAPRSSGGGGGHSSGGHSSGGGHSSSGSGHHR